MGVPSPDLMFNISLERQQEYQCRKLRNEQLRMERAEKQNLATLRQGLLNIFFIALSKVARLLQQNNYFISENRVVAVYSGLVW